MLGSRSVGAGVLGGLVQLATRNRGIAEQRRNIATVVAVASAAPFASAGALPVAERVNPDGTPVTSAPNAGPGGVDLGSMSPRQAADRLFDRVMREDEAGNEAQAQQFATMAIQAYGMLPPAEIDLDARFHLGLLNLVLDDPDASDREADLMLAVDSQHLLAFALKARSAGLRGDTAAQQAAYTMFLDALPAGLTAGNPEYAMHDNMLESEAVRAREATGRN